MNIPETMKFLRAAEKRITPKRRLLLCIISDNVHLHASEIYDLAKEEDPRISLSTVYRTVKLLKEHYHRICLGCGKVTEIPNRSRTIKGRRTPQDLAGRQSLLYVGEKGLSK